MPGWSGLSAWGACLNLSWCQIAVTMTWWLQECCLTSVKLLWQPEVDEAGQSRHSQWDSGVCLPGLGEVLGLETSQRQSGVRTLEKQRWSLKERNVPIPPWTSPPPSTELGKLLASHCLCMKKSGAIEQRDIRNARTTPEQQGSSEDTLRSNSLQAYYYQWSFLYLEDIYHSNRTKDGCLLDFDQIKILIWLTINS